MNNINRIFEVVIENWNEEFEIIEYTTFLEDAMVVAKNYPKENYKAIRIDEFDKYGEFVRSYEVE